ncbi:MAG: hypothetical protein WAM68_07950 [Acidobacteriaceae bacterium]
MPRPLLILTLLLTAIPARPQNSSASQSLAGTQSIGDIVNATDAAAHHSMHARGLTPTPAPQPLHILYMHGINQVGAGDSTQLRKAICRYLHACTVTPLGRLYAEGPFAVHAPPPNFAYMQQPIWSTPDDWSASAPFIDRYQISGNGHIPIVLEEINWWPIVYPIKCRSLVTQDAQLTGPAKLQLNICAAAPNGTQPDPNHPGRYLQFQWIPASEAADLAHIPRHANYANRDLKSNLMDWGFADAVLALGPTQQILYAGIRELLIQSLQAAGVDLSTANPQDSGPEYFFITHSLGSYLALATLDSDWLGATGAQLPQFAESNQQTRAANYFSAHTAGFYFLANQIELLELARVAPPDPQSTAPCPVDSSSTDAAAPGNPVTTPPASTPTQSGPPATASISHWQCQRAIYLQQRSTASPKPQIIAWSDPNDLLSWYVPAIAGVHVVNLSVRNAAFRIPPFLVSPTGAHANYAQNRTILRTIFKPAS